MAIRRCIYRINRTFDGPIQGGREIGYRCRVGRRRMPTRRVWTQITWKITTHLDCDETRAILPSSLLRSRGHTVVRDDGFARYSGRFGITVRDRPLFTGRLELLGRNGSHQFITERCGERCDEREHLEGWLSGRGHGRLDRYQLRAAVVARAELPDGLVANTLISRITGAVIRSG